MCVCVYDILYVLYVKKKLYLVVWHAPSKTRCSGGLSYIILAHVVCQLVRRPPSSYAVPIVRDIRTPLIIAVWAHTTAPLTICFVPTISVLIYFIGSIIIYYFGFTGDDATRDSRSMEKKNILKPPPWEPHRRRRAADLFFEFFRSTKRAYIHTVPRYVCS